MISRMAIKWYKEVDGAEDNSLMGHNQSGDVYQKQTACSERLEE
jgi:uncharacterized glyoxalase superfamily protein PhnB